jgi:hypothetical protein
MGNQIGTARRVGGHGGGHEEAMISILGEPEVKGSERFSEDSTEATAVYSDSGTKKVTQS